MAVTAPEAGVLGEVEARILELLVGGVPAATLLGELQNAERRDPALEAWVRGLATLLRDSARRRESSRSNAVWMASVIRTLAKIQSLARTERITARRFFREYYGEHRPLVIADVDGGGAPFAWSFETIRAVLGGETVEVMRKRSAGRPDFLDPGAHASLTALGEFIDEIHATVTNEIYLTAHNRAMHGPLRSVIREYRPMPDVVDYHRFDASLWMGPRGAISPLHYDKTNVLMVQLLGTKRVTLFGPHDECFLEHDPETLSSPIDPHDRDGAGAPYARYATSFEAALTPGSALFIPAGWWHHVESLSPSFSMSIASFMLPNVFPAALF